MLVGIEIDNKSFENLHNILFIFIYSCYYVIYHYKNSNTKSKESLESTTRLYLYRLFFPCYYDDLSSNGPSCPINYQSCFTI